MGMFETLVTTLLIAFLIHPDVSISDTIHSASYRYVLDTSTTTEITSFLYDTLSLNITVDLGNDVITLRKEDDISDIVQLSLFDDNEWDEITTISSLHHRTHSTFTYIPFEYDGSDKSEDITHAPNTHSTRSLLQYAHYYEDPVRPGQTTTTPSPSASPKETAKKRKRRGPPQPKAYSMDHVVASQHMVL